MPDTFWRILQRWETIPLIILYRLLKREIERRAEEAEQDRQH